MPTVTLTDAFPVLESTAYLNAGTCGPLPAAAAEAMRRVTETSLRDGRFLNYYEALGEAAAAAREAWGRLLGAPADELALTLGATDGIGRALATQTWRPGDELLTSDEEHPGIQGPLGALAHRHGVTVRVAPWDELAGAVSPATRLIATSHVGWLRGRLADLPALGATGVPVLLDGAQSAGAIEVDLAELRRAGVVAYAAAGQKWTCGPVGTGALWIDPAWADDGGAGLWPSYDQLADPYAGVDATPWPTARRLEPASHSLELLVGSLAALEVLEEHGWGAVHAAGVAGAARLAAALGEAGVTVEPRGPSTLVTWRAPDAEALVDRASAAGIVVRTFKDLPYVRASVGAWTPDGHLERLLAVAT